MEEFDRCNKGLTVVGTSTLAKIAPPNRLMAAHQGGGLSIKLALPLCQLGKAIALPRKCPCRAGAAAGTAMLTGTHLIKRCIGGSFKIGIDLTDKNERAIFFIDEKAVVTEDTKPRTGGGIALPDRGMIGKGLRSAEVIASMKKNCAVYFAAIGGAGALLAKSVTKADVVAFPELGPEAIYRLEVENFPVTVVIDCEGNDLYQIGREQYQKQ